MWTTINVVINCLASCVKDFEVGTRLWPVERDVAFYLVFTIRFPHLFHGGNLPCGRRHKIQLEMSSLAGRHRVGDTLELVRWRIWVVGFAPLYNGQATLNPYKHILLLILENFGEEDGDGWDVCSTRLSSCWGSVSLGHVSAILPSPAPALYWKVQPQLGELCVSLHSNHCPGVHWK